ncbi:MAG: DUF4386 family protein [Thermoleophilaceae bacterium]|jgi:hypothetical protein|nr:DUF4386 family protein [Thermoleophilaceae bacterium]
MGRSKEWLVPLTGVAFILVGIIGFSISGEPKSADEPVREIVDFYVDKKDSVQIGAIAGVVAGLLLIFFGAYLRTVLRAAAPEDEMLPLVAFIGLVIVAVGFAIDGTISFALAEAADDIDPAAVQALQALWDNDFLPIMLGVLAFLVATGISVIRSGALPKWLGWVMILLAIVGVTPIGFVAAIGAAILVLVLSILLSLRARSAAPTAEGSQEGRGQ